MTSASPYIGGISPFFPTAIDFAVNVLPFPSFARAKILAPGFSSERCPGVNRTGCSCPPLTKILTLDALHARPSSPSERC